MLGATSAIVEASPLSASQRLVVWESRFEGIRAVQDGRLPERLSGDELHRFTDELQVAAVREREAAEGITWGDAGSESDSDSAVGELVVFPGDGFRG